MNEEQRENRERVGFTQADRDRSVEIHAILNGAPERPGIVSMINKHERELYGDGGRFGLTQKLAIIWRVHIWLLCSVSVVIGWVARPLVDMLFKTVIPK